MQSHGKARWPATRPLLFLSFLASALPTLANGPIPPPQVEWRPGELVVKLRETRSALSSSPTAFSQLNADLDATIAERVIPRSNWIRLRFDPKHDVQAMALRYRALPEVEVAEPNYIFRLVALRAPQGRLRAPGEGPRPSSIHPTFAPNDPIFSSQWGLTHIQAPQAWDITQGSPSQIIAVIDTGIDLDHPDLATKIWTNPIEVAGDGNGDNCPGRCGTDDDGDGLVDEDGAGRQPGASGYDTNFRADDDENGYIDDFRGWDFVGTGGVPDNNPQDDNGHGTHTAGIAAAATNNGVGIAGVCPQCRVMPLKAFQANGSGASSDIAKAIDYAHRNGATVLSMSFSSPADAAVVRDALSAAYPKATLVAAAGNDRRSRTKALCEATNTEYPIQPSYPAHYSTVIGVEAIDSAGNFAGFSNCGYSIKSPGVAIESTVLNDAYTSWAGTSMAAPFVAGTAGLLRAQKAGDPTWNAGLIFGQLVRSGGNAFQALTLGPQPKLVFENLQITDAAGSCPSCDGDGVPDAGETVSLIVTIKNEWANATGVTATLTSSDASATVVQGSSNLGSIGPNTTDDNSDSPFRAQISSAAPHGSAINLTLTVTPGNAPQQALTHPLSLEIQRGVNKGGVLTSTETWTSDNLYVVDNLRIDPGGRLTIQPGAQVQIKADKSITGSGEIVARGTPTRPIEFSGTGRINISSPPGVRDSSGNYVSGSIFEYCYFGEGNVGHFFGGSYLRKSIFRQQANFGVDTVARGNLFTAIGQIGPAANQAINFSSSGLAFVSENTSVGNGVGASGAATVAGSFIRNNIFSSIVNDFVNGNGDINIAQNFWGTTDSAQIAQRILDFSENPSVGVATYQPFLTAPVKEAPPVVASITIDPPPPVGAQRATFTITFSKPMNMAFPPKITFGPLAPFTTRTVNLNPRWVGGVDVIVTTPGGTAIAPGAFIYTPPPGISAVFPATTFPSGEPAIRIAGTNLTSVSSVMFDQTEAEIVSRSPDTLVVRAPPVSREIANE